MKLWLVGVYVKKTDEGAIWDFQGIFDSKQSAIDLCSGHENWFVAECELNDRSIPVKTQDWPNMFYPNLEDG